MACFGKCNCGCCLTPGELASIASSVDIDWYPVDYNPGDPPTDSTTNVPFISDDCCHTAKWIRGTCCGYSYECQKALEYIAEESITVSNKIIQTEKLVLNPGATVGQNANGECIFTYDEPFPSADDICDTEVNCGTVTKTYAVRETIYDAVGYDFNEVRVSIYKRDIVCTEGQPAECKVIVEVAQSVDVILGGSLQTSVERTKTTSDVFECCEEIPDCFDEKEHDPEINCDDVEDNTKFSFGNNARYWLIMYKIYDDIDEVPQEITFDPDVDVAWPCGRIAFCGPDPGTLEENMLDDDICFSFAFDIPSNEGGSITQVAFSFSCLYCLDLGIPCKEGGRGVDGYDCVAPVGDPVVCLCDHPGWAGQNVSGPGAAMPGLGETYNTVSNAVFLDATGCFRLINEGVADIWPNECPECDPLFPEQDTQPAVPGSLRTICNYWDCPDCYRFFYDPAVAPYQDKIATVDAYSFTQSTPVINTSPICIQFRPTKITLNP